MAAVAVHAQTFEVSVMASRPAFSKALLGTITSANNGLDTDVSLKGQYGLGGRLTYNSRGYYGHELAYTLERATVSVIDRPDATTANLIKDRVNVQVLSYNFLIYFMPSHERWRPFVTGGLQAYRYGAPRNVPDFPSGKSQTYGANWGGGLKLNLIKHALVRWDFRDYIGGKPYSVLEFVDSSKSGGIIHTRELSMGLGITF